MDTLSISEHGGLVHEIDESYGLERNSKCAKFVLHSGFEATAVSDMQNNKLKGLGGPARKLVIRVVLFFLKD